MNMKVPFLDLPTQHIAIEDEILIAMRKIIRSSSFCSGPAVTDFEKQFSDFVGSRHCIAVNSGTSALHLAPPCIRHRRWSRSHRSSNDFCGHYCRNSVYWSNS